MGSAVASVTLQGMSFAYVDSTVTASLDRADCSTSSWTSATTAKCIGIRGADNLGVARVTVAGAYGTSSAVFTFDGFAEILFFICIFA